MTDEQKYRPRNFKERFDLSVARLYLKLSGKEHLDDFCEEEDIYASAMTGSFNFWHRLIFPRFFRKINVEGENLEAIRKLQENATIIYITKDIGQLEYNFFNYLFIKEGLPLARFVNKLSLWQWLPLCALKQIARQRSERFTEYGPLPHPVSSGYVGALIQAGNSVFFRLKSTAIFDDLYWYLPEEDPLVSLLSAGENSTKPVYLAPIHFIWDKRPEGTESALINFLPGFLARNIKFWRNYKNRAVVKILEPISLADATKNYFTQNIGEKARLLRADLLNILHQEKKVTTGPAVKPRSWLINELLEDEQLNKVIYETSLEKKADIEDVKHLAKKYADEIAAYISPTYIETAYKIMKWVLKNIYDGIVVNADGLASLKKVIAKAPVVLVPNHRSHMDYLLLSTILYENNITIPHIAAGLNMAFWPLGHIFRRCGAFFIRRKFGANRLYREVCKTYLKILLKEGHCQEFFIEGGRSRTGKLLKPRTGMLRMLAEGIKEGACKEAYFVPVSITYDQVIEEYNSEVVGGEKKKERTRDLLRLHRHLKKNYGRIYLRFGEPLKFEECGADPAECAAKLAVQLSRSINKEMVVTPVALTASAILSSARKGLEHEAIVSCSMELLSYLRYKNVPFSHGLASNDQASVIESIQLLETSKKLILHDEFDPMCYEIKDELRLALNYYKNNIIHYFVSASIIASILLAQIRKGVGQPVKEEVKERFLLLKRLFSNEFWFSTSGDVDSHIEKVMAYFSEGGLKIAQLELFKGLLQNYFESYLVALVACRDISDLDEKGLLRRLQKLGEHMLLLGKIGRIESLSIPVLKNAILAFSSLKILREDVSEKGKKTYHYDPIEIAPDRLKQLLEELA